MLVRSALWIGLLLAAVPGFADDLAALARDFWDWRANEGIGLYGEEMMLQAGQFDDSQRTR